MDIDIIRIAIMTGTSWTLPIPQKSCAEVVAKEYSKAYSRVQIRAIYYNKRPYYVIEFSGPKEEVDDNEMRGLRAYA
ncbi:hypothetical protein [Carboxydocella sp. ULO1]|uniref:hypothetical protein n=1 Tax=Carboxydocella sp. ULO1 TaxID=1926599 RepID=UPI0009ACDF0E|nr:hypothetical protein [Carboxydocella sp. ULO1]GAW28964.1 hypothetical protein ULO1_15340 [Carboxydocella sp. ULO1]